MIINSELNTCFELSKIRAKMVLNHFIDHYHFWNSTVTFKKIYTSSFVQPIWYHRVFSWSKTKCIPISEVTILLTQMRSLFFVTSQIRVLRSYSPLDKGPFKYSLGFMRTVKNSEFTLRDENELVGSVKLSATVFCFMVDWRAVWVDGLS